jgi:hypothetical protein
MWSRGAELFAKQPTLRSLALAVTALLALCGAAFAQACSDPLAADFLRGKVKNLVPAERQMVMDVIHRYYWALDFRDFNELELLFANDAVYEACSVNVQIEKMEGAEIIRNYIEGVYKDTTFQVRHSVANAILRVRDADPDTVDGKWMLLTSMQQSNIETPTLDYSAAVKATFVRVEAKNEDEEDDWLISALTLITDEPQIMLRAR